MDFDPNESVLYPRGIIFRHDLSVGARLTYIGLLSFSQDDGIIPGQAALAESVGASIDSVQRHLRELVKAGLISRQRRGMGYPDSYVINETVGLDYIPEIAPNPLRFDGSGIVYLVRAGTLHKIGFTNALHQRMEHIRKTLKHDAPNVVIVHTIKSPDVRRLENDLHTRFARQRAYGEWFALADTDVAYICNISDEV